MGRPLKRAASASRIKIDLPIGPPIGYRTRRVEVTLDERQRQALKALYTGLLEDGHRLLRTQDAIRFVLDKVADAMGE